MEKPRTDIDKLQQEIDRERTAAKEAAKKSVTAKLAPAKSSSSEVVLTLAGGLTAFIGCGALAALLSGCLPNPRGLIDGAVKNLHCAAIKKSFNDIQQRGIQLSIKANETEAERQERLETSLDIYVSQWEQRKCRGSISDAS
ncbi:hypothetical protein SynPROS71_02185 [Synechococcus sp. PROS-7-1]|uniref:hypothetical protein n=1 Tax=Synechococcus sp. PROS-7-1 TaxID=1442556 RepID=UPI0016473842|nr:hypothetical protein [Synechococcus sp. PROS-7-1]QNI85954.1 hypothetical protein SynPROS71_02185 [Synechococcus sp. PROS-7-1]